MITTFYREVVATERRRLLRLLIAEGPRFPRLVSFYHAEVLTRGMTALRHVLRYGVERGEFAPTAAVDYPQTIIGPAMVGAIWKMLFDDIEPIDLERLCDPISTSFCMVFSLEAGTPNEILAPPAETLAQDLFLSKASDVE